MLFNVPGVCLHFGVIKTSMRSHVYSGNTAQMTKAATIGDGETTCASVEVGNLPATSLSPHSTPMAVSSEEHAAYTKIDFLF